MSFPVSRRKKVDFSALARMRGPAVIEGAMIAIVGGGCPKNRLIQTIKAIDLDQFYLNGPERKYSSAFSPASRHSLNH
jgi:hypothetical protein